MQKIKRGFALLAVVFGMIAAFSIGGDSKPVTVGRAQTNPYEFLGGVAKAQTNPYEFLGTANPYSYL